MECNQPCDFKKAFIVP